MGYLKALYLERLILHTHTLLKKKEKRKKGVLTSSQKEKNRSSIAIAFFNSGTYFFLPVDVAKC